MTNNNLMIDIVGLFNEVVRRNIPSINDPLKKINDR